VDERPVLAPRRVRSNGDVGPGGEGLGAAEGPKAKSFYLDVLFVRLSRLATVVAYHRPLLAVRISRRLSSSAMPFNPVIPLAPIASISGRTLAACSSALAFSRAIPLALPLRPCSARAPFGQPSLIPGLYRGKPESTQDQIVMCINPFAIGELLEQRAVEATRCSVIDTFRFA
jgi:hypothetical protein